MPISDNASELRRRTDLLTALFEASQIFLGQLDTQTIAECTCRLAVDRFGLEMAWVGMITENSFAVHPSACYGSGEAYPRSIRITWDDGPTGRGPTGTAIRTKRAVISQEIDTDPNFVPWREAAKSWGYLSSAALPLLAGDRVLGTLNVYSAHLGYFTDEQILVLQSLANQAAIAIDNARLYEQTRHHNRELLLLNRVIAASADAPQDLSAFLATACRELAQAFGVPQSLALLRDEETGAARVVAEHCDDDRLSCLGRALAATGGPALGQLLERRAPLSVSASQNAPYWEPVQKLMGQQATGSLLWLPLLAEEQAVGSLGLVTSRPYSFSAKEMDLARRVADQVSGVLARVRLAQVQQKLSTAVEQAAEGIVITDTQGYILYVNPAFERISGLGRSEALGQNLLALRDSGRDAATGEDYGQALAAGRVWHGRFVGKGKDGTSYTEEATITPVRNPSGQVVSHIATMRDVTREIQLEEQFHRAQKMEAVGRLAGGIAHDFNNLLTIMSLSTRLLERGLRPEDPLWQHLQRIRESGDRATQLVKQLLTFSRKEIVHAQALDLNQVLNDLSLMLRRIIGEDIDLQIELAEDLWPVSADPSQLEQVIMNLVVNARDAMPGGGVMAIETANVVLHSAHVALDADALPGDYVMIRVSDSGIGMDREVKSHLFEPFFTTKERGKGTGLGLATVFGITKQSGGHIEVESEPGCGTTFRIYLPRIGPPASDGGTPGQERHPHLRGSPAHVLHPAPVDV